MSEANLMRQIQIGIAKNGAKTFRNNVGLFDTLDGRKIRTGLCVGSSDLIGWKKIIITPQMVGKQLAVFVAVEVKMPEGESTKEQVNFIEAVTADGGIAFVARSVEEAIAKLRGEHE